MVEMERINVHVFQIGKLHADEVNNILGVANICQYAFHFEDVEDLRIDLTSYKLPNGSYDLDRVAEQAVLPINDIRPLVILTSEPYGSPYRGTEANWSYFMGMVDSHVSIISTYLWENLDGERSLQPYLLFMLGVILISEFTDLQFHEESKGCVFDFCAEPNDIDLSLQSNRFFCAACQNYLNHEIAVGSITLDQAISAMRLINRARGIELSCFISYSHKDEEFAKRLYTRMEAQHLRVWLAAEDLGEGKIHEQLERSIRLHDKLLLILSENSMSSEWVKSEIRWAVDMAAQESMQKLLPIRLVSMDQIKNWKFFDADIGKDLAREIREYHIHDFIGWRNPDAFEASFDRLLSHLL
jgi:hypothetical protein